MYKRQVLAHAVADALLGAAALGDIGKLFPDTEERYRGADSLLLLSEVCRRVRESGHEIENIDATVMAQRPKLAPYILEMREKLAETCGITTEQISVCLLYTSFPCAGRRHSLRFFPDHR